MQDVLGKCLKKLNRIRVRKSQLFAVLLVLSLVVSLEVFWVLRQTGLTMAGDASCGIKEHTHSDACFTQVCICSLSEEVHVHTDSCYTTQFTPAREELRLACTLEQEPHVHTEKCYTTELVEAQAFLQLVCTETDEAHIHGDECYELVTADSVEEIVLNCDLQFDPHEHTENCYTLEVMEAYEEQVLTCVLPETAHIHDDSCYMRQLHCQKQEHIHSVECYSDDTADVETLLDWQNMFAAYPYTGDLRQDLIGIAKTQVGYTESTLNYEVGQDGIRHGYTRYGAWYGTPYRDWSAAFVSFCLNYAGADPEQTPGNIGANAMAEFWKNLDRFAPPGEYVPSAGDLVFFEDNTVGIVSDVQSTTFYAIRGDVDDAVRTEAILLNDASIAGWGITETFSEEPATDPTEESTPDPVEETTENAVTELTWEDLLDVSNGPVFFIFVDGNMPPQMQTFSLKNPRTTNNLLTYLTGVEGTLTLKLLTSDDKVIQPDGDEHYTVDPNVGYKLHMSISSPSGLAPGTYLYQLPQGLIVEAGNGEFIYTNQQTGETLNLGTWNVTADGLITLNFNDNMTYQSGITIPATMKVKFSAQDDDIAFDGSITVTVNPPPDLEEPTDLQKWGLQGYEGNTEGKTDSSKIYWTIKVDGNADSQIPGSVLTDNIVNGEWYGVHRYTDSDMDAGIRFGVTNANGEWHSWMVYQGDPNLEWTEFGWSYTMPETVICQSHPGEVLELGNDGWEYFVNYSSTPDRIDLNGSMTYTNRVSIDQQTFEHYFKFHHGEAHGEIDKTGNFHADAKGGFFQWEVTADIPGIQPGKKADFWYISDTMTLYSADSTILAYITNEIDNASVTVTRNGTTVRAPHINDATDDTAFAWRVEWSSATGNGNNGIENNRNIDLLCHCECNAENCPWWTEQDGCGSICWVGNQRKNLCQCWTLNGFTTFTLTYKTTDLSIIENYGGVGNQLGNFAELYYISEGDYGKIPSADNHWAGITVPGLFKKELTQDFNGYTAHYQITVNEAKLSLTDGSALHIHDEMTETLAFISGSLVITSEDANGNRAILQQDKDYTFTYDGTGSKTDTDGNTVHVLDITILHPQPLKYTLDYDATLIIPAQTSDGVAYSNSATVTLWGKTITSDSEEETYTEFGITGESYKVQLHKTCASSGEPLMGATFGLFNAQGGHIATGVTDENGQLPFQTNIILGIIFRQHELYYLQELQAPPGYQLDDTKHWFVFCNQNSATCETCTAVMADQTAQRIPYERIGIVYVTNEIMNYDLPATGGPGVIPLSLVSVMFVTTPFVYASVQRRKRERRRI